MNNPFYLRLICLFIAFSGAVFCKGGKLAAAGNTPENDSTSHRLTHRIGLDVRPSYVVPTNGFFDGDNASQQSIRQALSVHVKYAFHLNGNSLLGRLYPHAYQGIGIAYNTLFCPSELGTPVTVYAFQGSRIAQFSSKLSLDYEWNFGASFGWKKYDEEHNPQNVVIGSNVNAYLNFGLLMNWKLSPQWSLTAGIDATHYSNGNTKYPNAGVNLIGGRIGLTHTFGNDGASTSQEPFRPKPLHLAPSVSYDLVVYGATRKRGLIEEDESCLLPGNFAVIGLNFAPMYQVSNSFKTGVSLDAQYDESANLKDYRVEGTYADDIKFYHPPFRKQFAVGLSVRGEWAMPFFSINAGIGYNLISSGNDTKGLYQVLALKTFITPHWFLHVGYQLSKFKDPNNLMLGVGYRFHGNKQTKK